MTNITQQGSSAQMIKTWEGGGNMVMTMSMMSSLSSSLSLVAVVVAAVQVHCLESGPNILLLQGSLSTATGANDDAQLCVMPPS